jgi:hypothetical protein
VVGVDPEIIPVEDHVQVVQAQTIARILGLVPAAGGVAAFAFEPEDLHAFGAGVLESHGLTCADRSAVAAGSGVELHEEVLLGHLYMARKAVDVAEAQQVFPSQHALSAPADEILVVTGLLMHDTQGFVEYAQGGVNQGCGVSGHQDEPVAELLFGMADVPPHGSTQQQTHEVMDLGTASPGVPALTIVEHQVDLLIDDVLDDLPAGEVLLLGLVDFGGVGHGLLLSELGGQVVSSDTVCIWEKW